MGKLTAQANYKLSHNEAREATAVRPQGLKPASFMGFSGTAEAVPFPKPFAR